MSVSKLAVWTPFGRLWASPSSVGNLNVTILLNSQPVLVYRLFHNIAARVPFKYVNRIPTTHEYVPVGVLSYKFGVRTEVCVPNRSVALPTYSLYSWVYPKFAKHNCLKNAERCRRGPFSTRIKF